MDQRAGTPHKGDEIVLGTRGEKIVGDKAADAATELYVTQERADRRERFERVVRQATTAS